MSLRRGGITLIELLVAMTIGATIMAMATALLCGLLRAERAARNLIQENCAVNALADQFRRDAHATTAGSASNDDGWQFGPGGGQTVTYRVRAGEVLRVEQAGQSVRQQVFPLPPGMMASIEGPDETGPAIVRLVITAAPNTGQQPPEQSARICVDAACGLDHRFDASGELSHEETDE